MFSAAFESLLHRYLTVAWWTCAALAITGFLMICATEKLFKNRNYENNI